ncbi:dihydrofolate reductase [Agrococcus sp. Marseille-P2731]|uniref:dihydrofolate reductase n=1 Tax=Agrococcus sp. Marseille-P2731 TaxID=1841862 RepID=UPI00093182A8|nr:dihydrofolate reductase [Agrococcus sp. Marseille-P2731]
MLGMIWAQARGGVIGEAGDMPWSLPEDMQRFKAITMGHPVVMGRRTWESFPERFRPLPGRDNIVITSDRDYLAAGARTVASLEEALAAARAIAGTEGEVWVIGGGRVYRDALPLADRLEITDIDLDASGDTTAPDPGAIAADQRAHDASPADAPWAEIAREPATGWHTSASGLRYAYRSLERVAD